MFKKGTSGNPAGRPPGAANKATADLRQRISDFLISNWPKVEKDFKDLEPEKRIVLFEKLLTYILPKMSNVSLETDFDKLSDEQLDYIIENLKKSADE